MNRSVVRFHKKLCLKYQFISFNYGTVLHVVDYYPRGFITNYDATDTDRAFICDVNPNIGKDDKWTDWNSLVNKCALLFRFIS